MQKALYYSGTGDGVVDDLELPLEAGGEGVMIDWISDSPDIISPLGEVNRQDEDATVRLTALLYYHGYTDTKRF